MDLGFVVDSSSSLGWQKNSSGDWLYHKDGGYFNDEKKFIKQMATNLELSISGVHASVVQFSTTPKLEVKFVDGDDITKFTTKVDAIPWMKQFTRIDLALDLAYNEMFQTRNGMRSEENCHKVVIVMTDGKNENPAADGPAPALSELTTKRFHDDGIKVIVIGIGKGVDKEELEKLVKTKSNYHGAQDFTELVTDKFMKSDVDCEKLTGKQRYISS